MIWTYFGAVLNLAAAITIWQRCRPNCENASIFIYTRSRRVQTIIAGKVFLACYRRYVELRTIDSKDLFSSQDFLGGEDPKSSFCVGRLDHQWSRSFDAISTMLVKQFDPRRGSKSIERAHTLSNLLHGWRVLLEAVVVRVERKRKFGEPFICEKNFPEVFGRDHSKQLPRLGI